MLPTPFTDRLTQIIAPALLSSVINSFSVDKPVAFRVNTLKTSVNKVTEILIQDGFELTKINWNAIAYTIPFLQREKLTHHPLFLNGEIYIQSLASQLPALILDPQINEEILDLTAAPGSKTTQIAALMQNTGRLAAVEIVKSRFFKLKANIKTQGANNVICYLKDGARVGKACPNRFNRVLLDAPCSSEGRFNLQDPDSFSYWSLTKIKAMCKKQWTLLQSAFEALKPGGILVYSTCTFAPEENEMMIQKLLEHFPGQLTVLPIDIAIPTENKMSGLLEWKNTTLDASIQNTVRVVPDGVMDGFFVAKLRKMSVDALRVVAC